MPTIERKEPVAGDLDRLAESVVALGLGQAPSALAGDGLQPPLEMRADRRAMPQPRSQVDLWPAVLIVVIAIGIATYYYFAR